MSKDVSYQDLYNKDTKSTTFSLSLECGIIIAVLLILFILGILVIVVGGVISLGVSVSKDKQTSIQNQIGEDPFLSPHIMTLSSSISSLTIILINLPQHSTITAMIYIESMLPVKITDYLPPKPMRTLTASSQPSRYNYNYYDGDNPVYLLDGFQLIYELSISTVTSNGMSYPTVLALFNDYTDYFNYKNDGTVTPLAMSPPLKVGRSTWTFNITEPSNYYVALQVPEHVTVNSNASVVGVYYNTTGLDSPSDCSEPLSVHHPSCEVHVCQEFYCNYISSMYLLVDPTGNVTVKFDITSTNIDSNGHFVGFIVGLILMFIFIVFAFILVIVIIILCCKYCR